MSQKRSYLESLNAGRRRRPSTSIERLNRTLEELEGRIGAPAEQDHRQPRQSRFQEDRAPSPAYSDLARTVRQARSREEEFASVSQIANDLQSLRDEVRSQGGSGMGQEIAALRRDLERNRSERGTDHQAIALAGELERLSGMIERMEKRGDDRGVQMLRREIDEIKGALGHLAREDTVRSVGERWEDLDRRWDALASDLRSVGAGDPSQEALEERLTRIESAVRALPEALSLRTLEDKMRTLAGVVENLDRDRDGFGIEAIESIERRLDELSRAIVSSTSAQRTAYFDPEPLERIEARISALARQIEDMQVDSGFGISNQIETISTRVDDLAQRMVFPENAVERLASQIAIISDKLDTVPSIPDMAPIFRDLETRFDAISVRMDERHDDALEQGQSLFRELEQRLEQMASRQADGPDPKATRELVAMMDRRFAEISDRLEKRVEGVDGASLGHLEDRLDDIAHRLESTARATAGIDPALIGSLQAQVAALSDHLMSPDRPLPDFEDLAPRLDYIERSILETRDNLMEAARQAAEDAVHRLGSAQDGALAHELGDELRSLENLTRISDERNAKTFEAIHDTLIKIVDRLGSMEKRQAPVAVAATAAAPVPERRETIPSPSIAPEMEAAAPVPAPAAPEKRPAEDAALRAAEAASAAALAASTAPADDEKAEPLSLLGGISRAFRGKKKQADEPLPSQQRREPTAEMDFDSPLDPKLANRPLEPGSGAPDLNAIMRRVRDQRPAVGEQNSEAAKSDFIAAARRAAQAAAAEAEATKGRPAGKDGGAKGLGRLLPTSRKTAMVGIAALVVALGAFQLNRTLNSDGEAQVAANQASTLSAEAYDAPGEIELDASVSPLALEAAQAGAVENDRAPVDEVVMARAAEEPNSEQMAAADPVAAADPAPMSLQDYAIPVPDTAGFVDETEMAESGSDEALQEPLITVPVEAGPAALREAAETGNPLALFEIANRYADGRGVEANPEEAAVWYEMAAELGLAIARYKVGSLYEKGIGVERDVSVAESWYRLAAAQGNAGAMHNLGVLLAMGASGTANNEEAARWFLEAADLGVPDSQFNMGILSARGIGVPQDLEEGYKWFAILAEAGDNDALAKRDEVAATLTPEQVENAQAAAALWRAKEPDPESNSFDIPDAWTESSETTASVETFDVRRAVSDLQRLLNERGYDAGPVDGVIGQKTRDAIIAFQRAEGLEPNGDVNQALIERLLPEG
ncbi:MAG: peptidoglycan-binding protein [Mesorhizobium sp.]|nr:peptidoglycan-binding protein [Mesorhizobium sp.]